MKLEERASTPSISNSTLVYGLDMFILAFIFIFFLFNIPRTLSYIANHRSQVFQGYLLRSTTQSRMARSPGVTQQSTNKDKRWSFPLPTLESGPVPKQPWHFPMCFSRRHPAASFMQYRVIWNYTVVQAFLIAGYSGAVFYASFYLSNVFSYPKRVGWVIASQIPFVYAFATKNNVVGLLAGVGYEKLNYLHRHVGRLMVIGANVHAIGYIYKWTLSGSISKKITEPDILSGIVALICFDILGVFSIHYVRMRFYGLFFATHVFASSVVLFAACYHEQACIPYVIAGSVVYGLDHIIRAIKTRFAIATLSTIPGLELTQINVPCLNTGWRTGQHVRLRVLSPAMGFWTMTEVHPFTIASATNTEEGLVLMCKKTGKWTRKLYEMAQTQVTGEQNQTRLRVMIEGPYGGVGDTTVANYSGVMIVAGGSGVAFALSALQDLVLTGAESRIRVIHLVWSVRDPAALTHFVPLFAALAARSGPAKLCISIFCTRPNACFQQSLLPPDITLTPGRPRISELLREFVSSTTNKVALKGSMYGAFVGVCGPVSMARDVAHAVRTLDVGIKKTVGGIHIHEEVFGW